MKSKIAAAAVAASVSTAIVVLCAGPSAGASEGTLPVTSVEQVITHVYETTSGSVAGDHWSAEATRSAAPVGVTAPSGRSESSYSSGQKFSMAPASPQGQETRGAVERYTSPGFLKGVNGKVFFTSGGKNYQCSGSAVNSADKDVVVTAAHCVYSDNAFVTNLVFIPGYEDNVRPHGTWSAVQAHVTAASARPKPDSGYDYAVFEVAPLNGRQLADTVGALGWSINSGQQFKATTFGYPADAVNKGRYLVSCTDETYKNAQHQLTIGIACDMYGGTSGGPWVRTENGSTFINGVNSFSYTSDSSQEYSPYFTDAFRGLINNADND